ncbi:uncharacterized protein LOC143808105 isoform X1 [Ranitomeya variabilis]|uniref:uncharacterized protein LOC143808105 isoform X1 n=2 Tax=Ranitomeya variabilis TaxID=490064 RepID=UPI004056C994
MGLCGAPLVGGHGQHRPPVSAQHHLPLGFFIRPLASAMPVFSSLTNVSRILPILRPISPRSRGDADASCFSCCTVWERSMRCAASFPVSCAFVTANAVICAALRIGRDSESFSISWGLLSKENRSLLSTISAGTAPPTPPEAQRQSWLLPHTVRGRHDSTGNIDDQERLLKQSCTLYVGNLSFYTTEEQIYELFSKSGDVKKIVMGLDKVKKTACGFCFVEYYTRADTEQAMRFINGTRLDDRIIRTDWDAGFIEGRQYGRGRSGGQVRDEYRQDYDAGRGGYGKVVQTF